MANLTLQGRNFLDAFTDYVLFRLTESGEPKMIEDGHPLGAFVDRFVDLMESMGGKPGDPRFEDLLQKMKSMKGTRGGSGVPPNTGGPNG
jgi:hypothetical protein